MKTINVIKKVFISAIVLTMVMAFAFGFNVIVKAAPDVGYTDKITIEGVGIRTNGNQGMRFKVTFDDSIKTSDVYYYGSPYGFGVVIAYGITNTSIELDMTINDKKVISGEVTQLDGDNCYYITLYYIPNTEYMQNISVRPYISYWNGYLYGNETKVYNLTTVAYKAMNDGIESTLLIDVDTYMNANYKKVYVDEFDNLVFDGFRETNPKVLKELFINDINQYTNTTLTTDSSITDWVTQLQYNTSITDSKLYQAYNTTKFNDKWSWLFDYLISKGHIKTCEQISKLNNNSGSSGTNYNNLRNLIYSLYNFFNYDSLDTINSIPFNTESAYSTLTTSNIYPEIANYDIRKNGTSSTLGHEDGVLGYTVTKWTLNSIDYLTTDNYTVPSDNVKFDAYKICNAKYNIVQDTYIAITGRSFDVDVTDLVILPEYEGYPTTAIVNYAFEQCTTLTTVKLPNTLQYVGSGAFYSCSGLTSITIPNSVTSINKWAFYGCSNLTNIVIPNSIETIEEGLFQNCSNLKNVTIPNTITSIEKNAFADCTSLTSITIPNSVNTLGQSALSGCSSLKVVTIPDSVTTTGDYVFSFCSSLETVIISNNMTRIAPSSFVNCTKLKNVTIGSSVTDINNYAFSGCTSLETITIPDNVEGIGAEVFSGCSSLTSIVIPNNVVYVGYNCFSNCSKLTIYCEAASKPAEWSYNWNYANITVVWGYTGN